MPLATPWVSITMATFQAKRAKTGPSRGGGLSKAEEGRAALATIVLNHVPVVRVYSGL